MSAVSKLCQEILNHQARGWSFTSRRPRFGAETDMKIMGIPVVESPLCTLKVPVREHASKGRGSYMWKGCYCKRIQKKWNKRYGFKHVPTFFLINGGEQVVMHPQLVREIKLEMEKYCVNKSH